MDKIRPHLGLGFLSPNLGTWVHLLAASSESQFGDDAFALCADRGKELTNTAHATSFFAEQQGATTRLLH